MITSWNFVFFFYTNKFAFFGKKTNEIQMYRSYQWLHWRVLVGWIHGCCLDLPTRSTASAPPMRPRRYLQHFGAPMSTRIGTQIIPKSVPNLIQIGCKSGRNHIKIGSKSNPNRIKIGQTSYPNWTQIDTKSDPNRIHFEPTSDLNRSQTAPL